MTTPNDQADLSLALVARAIEKAQGALGVPALDKLHELFPATFAALATALTAAEVDVKVLRGMNRGRMHPGLAASIAASPAAKRRCPSRATSARLATRSESPASMLRCARAARSSPRTVDREAPPPLPPTRHPGRDRVLPP